MAGIGPGDTVVVVGAGPIGCLHVLLARSRGAARIILVELNRARLDASADVVHPDVAVCAAEVDPVDPVDEVLELTDGAGADVVVTAAAARSPRNRHC